MSATTKISSTATRWLRVTITGEQGDPSEVPPEIAIVDHRNWITWHVGAWERDGVRYLAKILVGPKGTVQLAPGFYRVWVKVRHADNETPVIYAGRVEVE